VSAATYFSRILAAYGGIFVAGSRVWGVVVDKFRPDRYDGLGAVICLLDVAVIMYAAPELTSRHAWRKPGPCAPTTSIQHSTVPDLKAVSAVRMNERAVLRHARSPSGRGWRQDPARIGG